MKIQKLITAPRCALAALCSIAVAFLLTVELSGTAQNNVPPSQFTIDPLHDGHGIMVWAYYNSNSNYDGFNTYGDFGFQTTQHGVLFSGAFAGNGIALTNLASTAITAFTNTTPPASTNAPVGWFAVTDTNGVSYRVALYR